MLISLEKKIFIQFDTGCIHFAEICIQLLSRYGYNTIDILYGNPNRWLPTDNRNYEQKCLKGTL